MDALVSLAISLAPELGKWLFGSTGERVGSAVAQAVQAVTGTSDPGAAKAVVGRDPQAAENLRIELAKIAAAEEQAARQADLDVLKVKLADVAGARAQAVDLARAGSGVVWGAPAVSLVVLGTFGGVLWATITHALPPGSETILNVLLGMLGTGFAAVCNYWLGSSAGSAQKTALLAMSQPPAAASPRSSQP
jgi:hypothetical protein